MSLSNGPIILLFGKNSGTYTVLTVMLFLKTCYHTHRLDPVLLSGINVVVTAAVCFCCCGKNTKNTGGTIPDVCKNVSPLHALSVYHLHVY